MSRVRAKLNGYNGVVAALVGVALVFFAGEAAAAENLGDVAANITGSFSSIGLLITGLSYVAGLGFAVGSIIKFKAHKDNAAQVPIGQPIGLLLVAAALLFLPSILNITGSTLFGTGGGTTAGSGGTTITGGQ